MNLPGLNWIYLNLPKFIWVYLNLHTPELTQFFLNLPEFTQVYLNLPEIAWNYLKLPEITWSYQKLPEITWNTWKTWIYLNLPEFSWIYPNLSEFTWREGLPFVVSHKSDLGNLEIRQLGLWKLAQWEILSLVPGKVLWTKCIGGLGAKINQLINRYLCEITGGPPPLYLNIPKFIWIYLNLPKLN